MIIARIKTTDNGKILAIAKRLDSGKLSECIFCDWNTVPNTLRIFDRTGSASVRFDNFKAACKFIFSC